MNEKPIGPKMGTRGEIIRYVNQKIEETGVCTHLLTIPLPFLRDIPKLVAYGIEREYKAAGWKSAMLMEVKDTGGYFERWEIRLIPHNYGFSEDDLSEQYDPVVRDHPDGSPHEWVLIAVDPIHTMRCPICSQLRRKTEDEDDNHHVTE